ncbi:MAG: RtcB family protein [Acidobacteriota bacterium]
MKKRELLNLGIPNGEPLKLAFKAIVDARAAGLDVASMRAQFAALVDDPLAFIDHSALGALARALSPSPERTASFVPRHEPAPYQQWGRDLEASAVTQIINACSLPITVRGALMPDAHPGYGLPIGGVLATRDAVIPYAVGVDIACRVKLSVFDLPTSMLEIKAERLAETIEAETRFGIGASFKDRRTHAVMDEDWSVTRLTRGLKDKAWSQLGTSGSGNHFVEFGTFEVGEESLDIPAGTYLALLTHSGSRGAGATIAAHFSRLAMDQHPDLPSNLRHLAWLSLASEEGQEYWSAMELMGKYASANHACIHHHIARRLGAATLLDIENHHNFAWREVHDGESLIVHRKGATPAGLGVLGVIPGSMASPTYVVRGKGSVAALDSAAHGAGRVMSRTAAKQRFTWPQLKQRLLKNRVTLLSAGLDEAPMVYKDIDEVMSAQRDLVEPLAAFHPRIVKMAPGDEPPED